VKKIISFGIIALFLIISITPVCSSNIDSYLDNPDKKSKETINTDSASIKPQAGIKIGFIRITCPVLWTTSLSLY